MKQVITSAVTPQKKIMGVNNRFGNPGLKKQQGSTVEIYDMIQVTGTETQFEFFINSKTRQFPFTNLVDGKLQPQESFALERAYFFLAQLDDTGAWVEITPLNLISTAGISMGELEFQIENQRVLKPMPLRSFNPEFNTEADNVSCTVFEFDTQIVIPPLLSFKATLKVPPQAFAGLVPPAPEELYIGLTFGGAGGIFAPKSNY